MKIKAEGSLMFSSGKTVFVIDSSLTEKNKKMFINRKSNTYSVKEFIKLNKCCIKKSKSWLTDYTLFIISSEDYYVSVISFDPTF